MPKRWTLDILATGRISELQQEPITEKQQFIADHSFLLISRKVTNILILPGILLNLAVKYIF